MTDIGSIRINPAHHVNHVLRANTSLFNAVEPRIPTVFLARLVLQNQRSLSVLETELLIPMFVEKKITIALLLSIVLRLLAGLPTLP
jgi:hypothetical protein